MTDPLSDTLFRPTTMSAAVASAAPVRVTGTRTRAGNAMNRTRQALLSGAAAAVSQSGTKISMAQVAVSAGVAKATLYNHFRTREAVLASLVVNHVDSVIAAQEGKALPDALVDAATAISHNPVRAALAALEPAALARIGRIDESEVGWQHARTAIDAALAAAGRTGGDTVLRWLASFVVSPAAATAVAADVAVLVAGLPPAPVPAAPVSAAAVAAVPTATTPPTVG